ncbi:MAG: WD40 repeat domain-containing protein [Candidatus Thorarchaeota archaeon]|jgi:WD40 repeat protein
MKAVQLSLEEVKSESIQSSVKHQGTINAFAIDDNRLYSVGSNGNLMLWIQETLRHQDTIPVINTGLESITVDENYLYVGSISDDNSIRVWMKNGMTQVITLKDEYSSFLSLTTTPNEIVAGRSNGFLELWNKFDWIKIVSIPSKHHIVLSVAVDDRFLYAGGIDDYVSIFRLDTFEHVTNLEGHEADVFSVAVDYEYVYSGSGEVWWGGPGSPRPPSFESAIRVWNKDSWECVMKLEGHIDNVNAIALDDDAIYSISDDGSLRVSLKTDWSSKFVDLEIGPLKTLVLDHSHIYLGGNTGEIWRIPKELFKS